MNSGGNLKYVFDEQLNVINKVTFKKNGFFLMYKAQGTTNH